MKVNVEMIFNLNLQVNYNIIKKYLMEVPGGLDNKLVVCYCEMIGTAFLILAVNWGSASGNTPYCVGLTVFGMA